MNQNVIELQQYDTGKVIEAMRIGGHFMTELSNALIRADRSNQIRIYATWGNEILHLLDVIGATRD